MKDVLASLLYDSWTDPIPELRAVGHRDRHLIFEGDGVILDLLLKKNGNASCIHVGGQVLPGDDSLDSVADVQVLIEQGSYRSSTHTNILGEFAFHTVPDETFDLAITFKNRRFIVRGLSDTEPRNWQVVPVTAARG
jgi:hypothetical protein